MLEVCSVCQKPLPKMPPSQQRKYCSMKCMGMDRRTLPTVKMCEICGKEWAPKDRFQAARGKTCSAECNGKRISQAKKGKILKPPRMTTCLLCGKEFRLLNSRRGAKYCSRSCRAKAVTTPILIANKYDRTGKKFPGTGLKGSLNPAWKGGITFKRNKGNYIGPKYIRCPEEYLPMARKDGYIMEHRLVMAQMAGRLLSRTEVVHHIDHSTRNNSTRNLELWPDNQSHKAWEGGRIVPGVACRLFQTDSTQP